MSAFLTIDIETVPQEQYIGAERYVEGGPVRWDQKWANDLATEKGIDALHEAAEHGEARLAATGVAPALHATTCHIVQVSFGWLAPRGDHGLELSRKIFQSDQFPIADMGGLQLAATAEQALIGKALDTLAGACQKGTTIVSFNGKQFDIPVLRARAAILYDHVHSLPPVPWRRLIYPYADDRHADLRLVLSADDRRAYGTLQWWADTLGIHAEEHGQDVLEWVRTNAWDKLNAYGMTEAQTLVEMYGRVKPIL